MTRETLEPIDNPEVKHYFSTKEICRMTGIPRQKLYNLINSGSFPPHAVTVGASREGDNPNDSYASLYGWEEQAVLDWCKVKYEETIEVLDFVIGREHKNQGWRNDADYLKLKETLEILKSQPFSKNLWFGRLVLPRELNKFVKVI